MSKRRRKTYTQESREGAVDILRAKVPRTKTGVCGVRIFISRDSMRS
jgi:hypothetical protein